MAERVYQVDVPAGVWELSWLMSTLVDTAATLGADIAAPTKPDITWTTEDLGQGETLSTASVAWDAGPVHVTAQADEHEIFDGATPRWGFIRGTVDGLPGGASIVIIANLSVGQRTATVTISAPRSTSPSGDGR